MIEALKVLRHAEAVLMKKVKSMKDGKPKYAANDKIRELRAAIDILKQVSMEEELDEKEEEQVLQQIFEANPPYAKA